MQTDRDITVERERVAPLLGAEGPVVSAAGLPDEPGLYTIWAVNEQTFRDLGLDDVDGEPALARRPLYLGKAQDSISSRVAGTHFVSGDTGHSTLRRTFAALLGLESRPRRSKIANPTPRQLRTLTTNFDLSPNDDEILTGWIAKNLLVRAATSAWTPLQDLEHAIGVILRPPLDQGRTAMWEPNPWREQVRAARQALQSRARVAAGLDP